MLSRQPDAAVSRLVHQCKALYGAHVCHKAVTNLICSQLLMSVFLFPIVG